MKRSKKDIYILLTVMFGFLIGAIMLLIGFIPQRDLKDYQRLTGGEGQTTEAVSTGAASSGVSGRKGGSTKYCTSWRYEIDGNERFFTDKQDCHNNAEDTQTGTTATLIYDPNDLGTVFVRSDQTLDKLEGSKTMMRIISIAGGVILAASIAGVIVIKRGKKPTAPPAQ